MFPIVKKRVLNETVTLMEIEAPLVARKALPGQFIIFRIDEEGERIPLTIAGYDREKGTVTIIFQKVGYTTMKLDTLNEGDALLDFVGPLGEPSHTEGVKRVAVIGGGNVAMDAARCARRLGADVSIVYRRSEAEMPARKEEVHHAKEEGIHFRMLTNPKAILGDENGFVRAMTCVEMELGEPDERGRRRPVPKPGSEFDLPVETVVVAIGNSPNPLIKKTTPDLPTETWGGITTDEHGRTGKKHVYAGGDAVTGAATVILAMGAGKKAAQAILEDAAKEE